MKNINRKRRTSNRTRSVYLLLLIPLFSGCSSKFIPGLDRVVFPNSTAKVGELLEEDISDENDEDLTDKSEVTILEEKKASSSQFKADRALGNDSSSDMQQPVTVSEFAQNNEEKNGELDNPEPKKTFAPSTSSNQADVIRSAAVKNNINILNVGTLRGKVTVVGENGESLSPENSMVMLRALSAERNARGKEPKTHIIDMEDKVYLPRFSTITAGDKVVFVNKDQILHNVFSPSGGNAFDLGTYGAGLKRSVSLSAPGVVKIYCNIHPDMATFVGIGDSGFSSQTDKNGDFIFSDVPTGKYELITWNLRGEAKQEVEVKQGQSIEINSEIITSSKTELHKNKFGKKYSKGAALFEDEFY